MTEELRNIEFFRYAEEEPMTPFEAINFVFEKNSVVPDFTTTELQDETKGPNVFENIRILMREEITKDAVYTAKLAS